MSSESDQDNKNGNSGDGELTALSSKEWLLTNGIGGFAGSSLSGINTRRYHGLLIASLNPPTQRMLMVSKVEETLNIDGNWYSISSNQFPGTVQPEGYKYITGFDRIPFPKTKFDVEGTTLERRVTMVHGSNTTVIEYRNTSGKKIGLRLEPLYGVRDYHGLLLETHDHKYFLRPAENSYNVYAYAGAAPVFTVYSRGKFTEHRRWVKEIEYAIDYQRGQDYSEDLYCVGIIDCELGPGETAYLVFSLDAQMIPASPEELFRKEEERLKGLELAEAQNEFYRDLVVAADQFIVHRQSTGNSTVIAGYHWFTDWGRDSMIALRGLCIARGRQQEAKSVILTFLQYLNQGIIPNRFPDYENDHLEYHTIDATLWLFVAVYEYDRHFPDPDFLKEVAPKLEEILNWHIKGTLHDIHVTVKGFLYGGTGTLPLTWMDARSGETVFTARRGCPVEINALWYNALRIYEYVCDRLGGKADKRIRHLADTLEKNFATHFWNAEGYLNDVVRKNQEPDESIRPNQIYAISLPFPLLSSEQEKKVVETVAHHLLTPYGLRTLTPAHPGFRPDYIGDVWSRDGAYHQGTVWPFLLPEFITAYLKVHNRSDESKREAEKMLQPLKDHFYNKECVYAISEIFDGLDPSVGKGCAQQAWSIASLIWLIFIEELNP